MTDAPGGCEGARGGFTKGLCFGPAVRWFSCATHFSSSGFFVILLFGLAFVSWLKVFKLLRLADL